jgi:hypothetical protein
MQWGNTLRNGLIGVGCALALIWFFLAFLWVPNWFARVPSAMDDRLLGTWSGTPPRKESPASITFRADGTAVTTGWGKSSWGTADGVLFLKFRSAGEGWVFEEHRYTFSGEGRTVRFEGRSLVLAEEMRAGAPESARF